MSTANLGEVNEMNGPILKYSSAVISAFCKEDEDASQFSVVMEMCGTELNKRFADEERDDEEIEPGHGNK